LRPESLALLVRPSRLTVAGQAMDEDDA
jgi:hypothetical protein